MTSLRALDTKCQGRSNLFLTGIICALILCAGGGELIAAETTAASSSSETTATAAASTAITPVTSSGGVLVSGPAQDTQTSAQQTSTPASSEETTPSDAAQAAQGSKKIEEGEELEGLTIKENKISLDLRGIEITELLRVLSMRMGISVVPTKSVSGRVNIYLNNITFEDALDVLLASQDLACDKKGDVINVMTSAEFEKLYGKKFIEKRKFKTIRVKYAKPANVFNALSQLKSDIGKVVVDETIGVIFLIDIPEKLELMEKTAKELDSPLPTELFDIKYAKPADMKTQMSSAVTTGAGEVFVDERSSKMVISDLPDKMKKLKRMIKAFDEESRQVFLEAEILQITLKQEYQRGMDWEKIFRQRRWHDLDVKGTFPVATSFTPSPLLTADYLRVTIGTLATDAITGTLDLLETLGDTKILSRPRLAVVNNTEAKILVGSREAYITQSQSQAESTTVTAETVEFLDVGIKINVLPTINKDGFITMKIKPEVSSVRETLTTSLGSKVPILETSEAETTVKIKDGSIIMIAGLIKEDKRKDVSGLPVLSKIPVIGTLFGTRAGLKKRTELVIFIKPTIITGAAPIPGTEVERIIPTDIMPKEMKKSLVEQVINSKVDKIKVEPPKEELPPELMMKGPRPYSRNFGPQMSKMDFLNKLKDKKADARFKDMDLIYADSEKGLAKDPRAEIQNRMKGLKEY